jgi:hypothetical protein
MKILVVFLLITFSYTGYSYERDDTVQSIGGCEEVDEGIVCIRYSNTDHVIKNCKFKAKVAFADAISGQFKIVRGNNFTQLLAFQEIRLCFDFTDHLNVYDPWTGDRLEDDWEFINLQSTYAECVPAFDSSFL